jgi:hypothetical protein
MLRTKLDDTIEVSKCSVEIATTKLGIAAVSVDGGIFRIEFDSLIIIGQSSVQLALPLLDCSPVAVSFGKLWIELDAKPFIEFDLLGAFAR